MNCEDIVRTMDYNSYTEIEEILNEAAISATYQRKEAIETDDLIDAVLRVQFDMIDDCVEVSEKELWLTALHEAGHIVVSEVLESGCVGMALIRGVETDAAVGFVHSCKALKRKEHDVLTLLGGKAAVELYDGESYAGGCQRDLTRAYTRIRTDMTESGSHGLGMLDVTTSVFPDVSENMNSRNEAVVQAELERCMGKTRDILLKNRRFLEALAEELAKKKTLLYSEICRIRQNVGGIIVAM